MPPPRLGALPIARASAPASLMTLSKPEQTVPPRAPPHQPNRVTRGGWAALGASSGVRVRGRGPGRREVARVRAGRPSAGTTATVPHPPRPPVHSAQGLWGEAPFPVNRMEPGGGGEGGVHRLHSGPSRPKKLCAHSYEQHQSSQPGDSQAENGPQQPGDNDEDHSRWHRQ